MSGNDRLIGRILVDDFEYALSQIVMVEGIIFVQIKETDFAFHLVHPIKEEA